MTETESLVGLLKNHANKTWKQKLIPVAWKSEIDSFIKIVFGVLAVRLFCIHFKTIISEINKIKHKIDRQNNIWEKKEYQLFGWMEG